MPSNPNAVLIAKRPDGTQTMLKANAAGVLLVAGESASKTALNVSAATLIVAGTGYVIRVMVLVAGTAAGSVNDAATVGAAATANQLATLPNTVGPVMIEFPFNAGLVVTPGAGQVVAVAYS